MPLTIGCRAIQAKELNKFQTFFADFNRFVRFLCRRIEECFLIEFRNFRQHTVTDKFINSNSVSVRNFFCMEFCIVPDNNIVKDSFKVTQFNFYSCAIVFFDEILNFCFISNINIINDNFFDIIIQFRNSLMNNAIHCNFIKKF